MKALAVTLLLAITSLNVFAQNTPLNESAAGHNSTDSFIYNGKAVSHYGLGWYQENLIDPPIAYLSGFSGLKIFTEGQPRIYLNRAGNLGIGTDSPEGKLDILRPANGWLLNLKTNAFNPGDINGIKFYSGYLGDNKWAGISSVTEDIHSNQTGLAFYTNTTEKARISGEGNFKLGGWANDLAKLSVYQSLGPGSSVKDRTLISSMSSSSGADNVFQNNHWLVRNSPGNTWSSASWHDGISVDGSFQTPNVDTRTWWERDPYHNIQSWGSQEATYLTINQGNVGVGTSNPDAKLSVNGTIHSKEVKVDTNIPVPDFVFKKDYPLRSIPDLKRYITSYHHLPEIPSAEAFKKDGINLSEMNLKLLQKVEELTLYLIEKEKQLASQQKRNTMQDSRLAALEKALKHRKK